MNLLKRFFQNYKAEAPLFITASTTLDEQDQLVRITATADVTVTLPPVNRCAGMTFSVIALSLANTKTLTIQDQDESEDWADITLTAGGARTFKGAVLLSDGRKWITLWSDVADS